MKSKGKKKKEASNEDDENEEALSDAEAQDDNSKKPRIRIKVPNKQSDGTKSKKGTKRKGRSPHEDGEADAETEEPATKKQKKKTDKTPRKKVTKTASTKEEKPKSKPKPKGPRSIFLNISHWRRGRMDLDKSFKAARDLMTSKGPWTLPSEIPDDKFKEVALDTLERVAKVDKYSVFAEAVTEDEAPGYFDVVSSPMDFGTMEKKVNEGAYGKGSVAASKLYEDFLLIFDNCLTYNEEDGEIAEEASRILGYIPEAYVNACLAAVEDSS